MKRRRSEKRTVLVPTRRRVCDRKSIIRERTCTSRACSGADERALKRASRGPEELEEGSFFGT